MKEQHTFTLSNGLRVVYTAVAHSAIGHCALLIASGTRDEEKGKEGMAHFIEHCLFKGTKKRSALQVISSIDSVGGELNAYTSKEETCIYASFHKDFTDRAYDLVSDIVFHSVFPANEVKKEKGVVIDEIHSYEDSPAEMVYDLFEEKLFAGNPLGHNVLGTVKSVTDFTIKDLKEYIEKKYTIERMVLSLSADLPLEKIIIKAEKYFGKYKNHHKNPNRKSPAKNKIFTTTLEKDTHQNHTVIGGHAPSYHDNLRLPFVLLNNILGGHAMNSRLNLALREKYGYAYTVESAYSPFSDCGNFAIYFGTDKKNNDKCISLVQKELKKLKEVKLSKRQLDLAKIQIKGHLALSDENRANKVIGLAKTFSVFNKVYTYQDACNRIDKITADEMMDAANKYYDDKNISTLIFNSK